MEKGKVNMEKKDRCAGNGTAVFLCEEWGDHIRSSGSSKLIFLRVFGCTKSSR